MFFRVIGGFLLYHKNMLKAKLQDIVQPKMRGVKRGTNGFASTSYTIGDFFMYT
jgi:hypothetical protein